MAERPFAGIATEGSTFVDGAGNVIRLRGVCLGGWLNMENFITGYAGTESRMRAEVRAVLGDELYEFFFDRLLTEFFGEDDAKFLGDNGFTLVRIPVNHRHIERDDRPFEILEDGFRHLDRAVEACGRHGVYSLIDLHALPGSQNQHWHSDNADGHAAFWDNTQYQDRVVAMWEAIAERYRGNPWVAGYNLMNEPADESRRVVGPYYKRLFDAVRAIDPDHTIFLDGNTYSTEFDIFDAEPWPNTVYSLHDYVPAGLGRGGPYPGITNGVWIDRQTVLDKFLRRSEYARRTGTPLMVGEFAPIYTGDLETDAERRQILADQLEIYRDHDVSWTSWMYKDLGRQGLVSVRPDSAYLQHFGDFVAKKNRLAADRWGGDGVGVKEVSQPLQDLIAREFPDFDPYPWGAADWVRLMLLNITISQPLAAEYAALFRGLGREELAALASSFAFENCSVRESLLEQLVSG
ncbi:glycoside hydrolase family 5 protein [Planctomonas psychrotolerans]|uniref:glycoside hydrolase family 5 protein n=1 Tax=Planctomonas psychrotolerans TaxID=2528712 RepID=UPI00123C22ED|nr:glycoside hydrolase family 5 protein [Planctomonas psychrotolerans]